MEVKDLEPGERFIWNWRRCGQTDFYRALIHLMMRADPINMARIQAGFPEEVAAYLQYRDVPGWWPELEARMEE